MHYLQKVSMLCNLSRSKPVARSLGARRVKKFCRDFEMPNFRTKFEGLTKNGFLIYQQGVLVFLLSGSFL